MKTPRDIAREYPRESRGWKWANDPKKYIGNARKLATWIDPTGQVLEDHVRRRVRLCLDEEAGREVICRPSEVASRCGPKQHRRRLLFPGGILATRDFPAPVRKEGPVLFMDGAE